MLSQKDFVTSESKYVTWNYYKQILHWPSGIVKFEQVNTVWVINKSSEI